MPHLTVPPPVRRRDRPLAHPELMLAPGWVLLGCLGVLEALEEPWRPIVTSVAIATAALVSLGGALLVLSVLWPTDRLSQVWRAESAGWIVGATGWVAYAGGVGYRSRLVLILTVTFVAVAAYRLRALSRTRTHIRRVKRSNGRGVAP